MYKLGYRHGREAAIKSSFGIVRHLVEFETPDEQFEYERGYADGWDSVD